MKSVWQIIGVVIVAAAMAGAVMWGYTMRPAERVCGGISYIIEDKDERLYVTERELDQVLQTAELHPVGKKIDKGVLHRIEQTIGHHPMVRTAECYTTPRDEVRVRITQRVPLLRVLIPGDTYLVDTDRKVMPARAAVKDDVMIATGAVGVQMATRQLADFAVWLQSEPYWEKKIDHVTVQSPKMVHLYLRSDAAHEAHARRLALGTIYGYERKMKKMRTFLDNSAEAIREKQYDEYDLRYKGQVIGRK